MKIVESRKLAHAHVTSVLPRVNDDGNLRLRRLQRDANHFSTLLVKGAQRPDFANGVAGVGG